MAANLPNFFGDVGGVVSDIYKAEGDRAEAKNYGLAADLARQNEQYTQNSTNIKNFQSLRQSYQATGGIVAANAAGGFKTDGAMDLLRSSTLQGAIDQGAIQMQGHIQEQGYEEQAKSYDTMAEAENKAAEGATLGAWINGAGAAAALFLA